MPNEEQAAGVPPIAREVAEKAHDRGKRTHTRMLAPVNTQATVHLVHMCWGELGAASGPLQLAGLR